MAKCQLRAPASQPPKVAQRGAGVPSHGHSPKVSPRRAKRGYALKMRSPLATITPSATTFTQWVMRTMGWCRGRVESRTFTSGGGMMRISGRGRRPRAATRR